MGLAVASAVLAAVIFRLNTQGGRFSCLVGTVHTSLSCVIECLLEIGQHPKEEEVSEHGAYRQILGLRAVHLMAFFIMVYVGYVFCEGSPSPKLNVRIQGGSYARWLDRHLHH